MVTRVTEHGVNVGQPSRTIYFTFISVLLYFLPIIIMTVAYSLIIWRLWSSSLPGERVESEVRAQNKIKKRVGRMSEGSIFKTIFGPRFLWAEKNE